MTVPTSAGWRAEAKSSEFLKESQAEIALERTKSANLQNALHASQHGRREEVKELTTTIQNLTTRLDEESNRHGDSLNATVAAEAAKYDALKETHSRLRNEHAALQAAVGRAGGGARGASDLETDLTGAKDGRFAKQLELVERNTRAEGKRAYDALEYATGERAKQITDRYESFLSDARGETEALKSKAQKDAKVYAKTVSDLKREVSELRKWSVTVNEILVNIEQGSYPVVQRGVWRSLRVPAVAKVPGSNNESDSNSLTTTSARAKHISLANANAASFLEGMQDDAMTTSGFDEFRGTGHGTTNRTNVGGRETQRPDSAAPTPYGVTAKGTGDSVLGYSTDNANSAVGETFEMRSFRDHASLIEQERNAVQAATLKELSSHPTVEYIRKLEEENKRLTASLSLERRSNSEARVALTSAQRTLLSGAASGTAGRTTASGATGSTSLNPTRPSQKPRASSARLSGSRAHVGQTQTLSAFGATNVVETFAGPKLGPDSFRATNVGQFGMRCSKTGGDLTSHMRERNPALTSPEVQERVRVTTLTNDQRRRNEERRLRLGLGENTRSESIGYLRTVVGDTGVGGVARQSNDSRIGVGGVERQSNDSRISGGGVASPGRSRPVSSGRPGFGVASGRRREVDRNPIPGRPQSGSAEVGYGFVLGDGRDAFGGTVGWPANADRTKHLRERPSLTNTQTNRARAQSARPGARAPPSMPTIEASEVAA
jgi:hypothetical protein